MEAQATAARIKQLIVRIEEAIAAGDTTHAQELLALAYDKARKIEDIMRNVKDGKWRG